VTTSGEASAHPGRQAADFPSDDDVVKSATAAIAEIRQQIGFQAKDADSLDTKAAAIFTVTGAGTGLVVSRLSDFDTAAQVTSGIAGFVVVVALLLSAAQVLRPRQGFSYGAEPSDLVAIIDRVVHKSVLQSLADALVVSRARNVEYLAVKQDWYQRALRGVVAAAIVVGWMIQTGALG
jgi:hypothetical protein